MHWLSWIGEGSAAAQRFASTYCSDVNRDKSAFTPLTSLERILLADGPITTTTVVSIDRHLFSSQSYIGIGPVLRICWFIDSEKATNKWANWFTEWLGEYRELLASYRANLEILCLGKGGNDEHNLINRCSRYLVDPREGAWPGLTHLFANHSQRELASRYQALQKVCEIPYDGIAVLGELYSWGNRWEVRKVVYCLTQELAPYAELDSLLDRVLSGQGRELGSLTTWIENVAKADMPVRVFYRFIESIIPVLPAYRAHGPVLPQEAIARVLLTMKEPLAKLFEQEDPKHAKLVTELIEGRPLEIREKTYRCSGKAGDGCHVFRTERGEEQTFRLSKKNLIVLNLAYAQGLAGGGKLRRPKVGWLWDSGVMLEVDPHTPFDWKTEPPGLIAELNRLVSGMPLDLAKAAHLDGAGQLCWVFDGELVPFNPAAVEKFLHDHNPDKAADWVKRSVLLALGGDQRERVLTALEDDSSRLDDPVESDTLAILKRKKRKNRWSVHQIRMAFISARTILHLPANFKELIKEK